jgi:2-hydroxychromene-2-carboxylate isomerase
MTGSGAMGMCEILYMTDQQLTPWSFSGRNGGQMVPYSFVGFRRLAAQHSIEQALQSLTTDQQSVNQIRKILDDEKLTSTVDLTSEGLIWLFFSEQSVKDAEDDYAAAKRAGFDVSAVEWIDKEDMFKVSICHLWLCPFD